MQHRQRLLVRGAALDGRGQQPPRAFDFAVIEGLQTLVHERFGLALTLGLRSPHPIDVGAGPVVGPVEKEDASPDVDRVIHPPGKVIVEPRDEQLFDARLAFGVSQGIGNGRVAWRGVDHACKSP